MAEKLVLVVDDDEAVREILKKCFANENFSVITAANGRDAVKAVASKTPDIVVMDLMMPGMTGLEALKELRGAGCDVPVILLTSKDEESDRLVGLEVGADDYVGKPFSPKEVLARAKAILRRAGRSSTPQDSAVTLGDIKLDPVRHEVTKAGKPVELTPIEFKVLELFFMYPGRVLSRVQIMERVQGYEFDGYQRTIDAHIKNIRKKIERDPSNPKYILTVFGVGYKFVEPQ